MTFRSVPWTSQPQGVGGIDWSNPLTKKLIWASVGAGPSLIGSPTLPVVSGGFSVVARCAGRGFKAPGTQIAGTVAFPSNLVITGGYSIAVLAKPGADMGATSTHYFAGPWVNSLAIASNGFTPALDNNSLPTIPYVGTKPELFMATRIGNQVIGYVPNGASASGVTGTRDQTITSVGVGREAGNNLINTETYLVLVFHRSFTRAEYLALAANPYQIFATQRKPIFVDIPVDHNIYAYTDESATTNETSEYPSTGSVFNEVSQDTNSSAESSSVLVNLNAASIEPSTSQESSTSQAALQAARVESNALQDTQTQGATSSNTTADTNSVTDSSIKVYTAQTTLNDTNSVVDNQTAQAQLYAARSEVNNAVESISALAQLYAAKTESSSATETSTQGASSSNNTTDSTSVTESSTRAYTAQATLSDSNTSTDGSTVQAQFYAAKTEAATTLDSLLAQASLLAVKLEIASPTDSRTTSATFVAAQLNTVNIIDTYAAIASLTAQLHAISNSIEVLLSNSVSSSNTLEITTALDDFYALLEQLIYQLSQVVFMNETLAFTLIPISRTTSLRAETNAPLDVPASSNNEYSRDPQSALLPSEARNTTFNSSIRLNQFLATKPITTYIRT